MELIEERMKDWRAAYDDMLTTTETMHERLTRLQVEIEEAEAPYRERMKEIEAEIREFALARAQSVKAHGVIVGYRNGYMRVSYDSKQTDIVLGVLRDVLPETAHALEGARKVSFVQPSISVKAV